MPKRFFKGSNQHCINHCNNPLPCIECEDFLRGIKTEQDKKDAWTDWLEWQESRGVVGYETTTAGIRAKKTLFSKPVVESVAE